MTADGLGDLVWYVRRAAQADRADERTDPELLEQLIRRNEGAAFAELMRRHGPMVLGVCRRVLGNAHDAEDAFQATFLVLVRRAASIVPRAQVGSFLYGVAYRTALHARALAARRRGKERQVSRGIDQPAAGDDGCADLIPVLDEELNRLPEKYRAPILLCHLEGKSRKEAARQLGVPEGTLSSRLATARKILARRLAQRGLSAPAAVFLAILSRETAKAAVPAALAITTSRAASHLAAGKAVAACGVSAATAALTEGVCKAMLLNRLKRYVILSALVALLALGGPVLGRRAGALPPAEPEPAAGPRPARPRPALRGTWKMIAYEVAGLKVAPEAFRAEDVRLIFQPDNRVRISVRGKVDPGIEPHGTYTLDPTTDPKQIDLTFTVPGGENKIHLRGIYSQQDDRMRAVFAFPGSDRRPRSLDAEGDGPTVHVTVRRIQVGSDTRPAAVGRGSREAEGRADREDTDAAALRKENRRLREALRQRDEEVRRLRREVARSREEAPRAAPRQGEGDRLDKLLDHDLESDRSDRQILDDLYLATLSRFPTAAERRFAVRVLGLLPDRRAAFSRLLWLLTNSEEFRRDLEARCHRAPQRSEDARK